MKNKEVNIEIKAPNFQTAVFRIKGTAPYVQNKFSNKSREIMKATQEQGDKSKKGKARKPKDFKQGYKDAMHIAKQGWNGIPAPAFRNAMISACRLVGFAMTRSKLGIFIEADGFDKESGDPLVKIKKGKPRYHESAVRNATGVPDIRPRPMWDEGWEADVRIRFDADMFDVKDISNLLCRAGLQVGIGEGRPDSKKSNGVGWGLFTIKGDKHA